MMVSTFRRRKRKRESLDSTESPITRGKRLDSHQTSPSSSLSCRVLLHPFLGSLDKLGIVGVELFRNRCPQRVVRVRVFQETGEGREYFGDFGGGFPDVGFQEVHADGAVVVDVAVVDFGREFDLDSLEMWVRKRRSSKAGSGQRLPCPPLAA